MSSETEYDFDDITPKSIRKRIDGKEREIREVSAAGKLAYRTSTNRAIKLEDGKVSGVGATDEADLVLISYSVFTVEEGKSTKDWCPLSLDYVKSLPDRVTSWVVEKIKELSPSLEKKVTVQSLDKDIAKLVERRNKLMSVQGEGQGDMGKGSPSSTTSTSD